MIAGGTVRAVLELAGVKDVLTKAYGSTNQKNLAKAVIDGLEKLRTRETIATLRGVTIDKTTVDEKIELGERFAPAAAAEGESEKAKAPVNVVGKDKSGGRGSWRWRSWPRRSRSTAAAAGPGSDRGARSRSRSRCSG